MTHTRPTEQIWALLVAQDFSADILDAPPTQNRSPACATLRALDTTTITFAEIEQLASHVTACRHCIAWLARQCDEAAFADHTEEWTPSR